MPQWKIPKSLSVSPYLGSRKDRVAVQKAAQGASSGPTGAEVDAWVASTLTRSQGLAAARSHAQGGASSVEAQVDTTGLRSASAGTDSAVASAATATATANATGLQLAELPTDERGRRLGLEDEDDPQLQDDPAVFAVSPQPQPLPAATGTATADAVLPTSSEVPPDLVDKVTKATHGRQTTVRFIAPPSVTGVDQVVAPVVGQGFVDPRLYGGTSFDLVGDGEHEPLNVIVSALSSPEILTKKGLQSYMRSLDFDKECLGLHSGGAQKAWLDPRGWRDEEWLFRKVYTPLDHLFGTCIESLVGGNHFRAWQQQGTGAWFLATSKEQNVARKHMIVPDGYNIGRDELVEQSQAERDTVTSFFGKRYRTSVEYVAGLMPPGQQGVNHDIAVDGLTAILTVTLLTSSSSSASPVSSAPASSAAVSGLDTNAPEPVGAAAAAADPSETEDEAGEAMPESPSGANGRQRRIGINDKTKELWRRIRHKPAEDERTSGRAVKATAEGANPTAAAPAPVDVGTPTAAPVGAQPIVAAH
ncbi:uncharacterized protein PSFLO_06617 [Pseudozyma flocculosa]|nr:uncharacterized protein PSFLO_06617 [Pseudozyma flocculosa]